MQLETRTMRQLSFIFFLFILITRSYGQETSKTEFQQIEETLMLYIDGTSNGNIHKLRNAFHPDFNLYTITQNDSLKIRSGKQYISRFEEGRKTNRIGQIISIDYENNAAIAKVEIEIPKWKTFIDYFLLMKYNGSWKIVQKSYTSK